MADPVVVTDSEGRAWLPHDLGRTPRVVVLRQGAQATAAIAAVARFAPDSFDPHVVSFRVTRADTGAPLAGHPVTVRMDVR